MRRVILSRKGFDSSYGGMPSVFVDGGEMVSFPIPHKANDAEKSYADSKIVGYGGICAEGMSLCERIGMLKSEAFAAKFDRCHHDPDLRLGVFGQSGPAQRHLRAPYRKKSDGVKEGDLFLFFGWFQEAENGPEGLCFRPGAPDLQALFGYLQVGEILPATDAVQKYERFRRHPHLTRARLEWDKTPYAKKHHYDNTVYIAAECLSIPGVGRLPGYGVFRHSPKLVLTASKEEQEKAGLEKESRTVWNLPPDIFRKRRITYHLIKEKAWLRNGLFQSRPRGQEFIVYDEDGTVTKWAADLIRGHHLRS